MFRHSCSTCRAIRAVILLAGLAALLISYEAGTLPDWFAGGDLWVWLLRATVLWSLVNVLLNLRVLLNRR